MGIRVIRTGNDPVLRQAARPVAAIDPYIWMLLDDMAETMYYARGIGLAATQIGILRRVIVADVGDGLVELVNPQWRLLEGETLATEGCLSLPGKRGFVKRAQRVIIAGVDRYGQELVITAQDLYARCLQHEVDHLNGVLFVDKEVPAPSQESVSERV